MSMDERTRTALEGSIEKWELIVSGEGTDQGTLNCPLCELFWQWSQQSDKPCEGCPVSARTGLTCCRGTPYPFYREALAAHGERSPQAIGAAMAELNFLQNLRPVESPASVSLPLFDPEDEAA